MKRKSNKKLTIALLALLGVVSTAGTYAYWQGTVKAPTDLVDSNQITIGSGADVATVITLIDPAAPGKALVPTGFVVNPDTDTETDTVVYDYVVTWLPTDEELLGKTGTVADASATLNVSAVVSLVGVETPDTDQQAAIALVSVVFDKASYEVSFTDGVATTAAVKVTVTLGEPGNKAVYDAIATKAINIALTFTVGNVVVA